MEDIGADNQSDILEIAADGDIILVVGSDEVKLRVHSIFLKAASTPFSAMLGPNWKEGHDMLSLDGPVELLLPEGNATALTVICAVIHHQNRMVPHHLAARDVYNIAVTADEYDCIGALRFASDSWLQLGKSSAADLMLLTAAAYLFNNAAAFKEITKALILDYHGSYLALSCREVELAMTWRVFCK